MKTQVIVVLNHFPISFSCDYLYQISSRLSKHAEVVIFNPFYFPSVKELCLNARARGLWIAGLSAANIRIFPSIGFIPFQRFFLVKRLNTIINIFFFYLYYILQFGLIPPLLWVFSHEFVRLEKLFFWKKGYIYDRADHPASVIKRSDRVLKQSDAQVIRQAMLVLVNSPFAYRYVRNISPHVMEAPWGVDEGFITRPRQTTKDRGVRIGFVSHIDHRFDTKLLYALAKKEKDWKFIIVGGILPFDPEQARQTRLKEHLDRASLLPNVTFTGELPKKKAVGLMHSFDVCLVLYDSSQEFVKGSNPMKVYEYLAVGRPVVSTPIEAIERYSPSVVIARNAKEFQKEIQGILHTGTSVKDMKTFQNIARSNSWTKRVELAWKRVRTLL